MIFRYANISLYNRQALCAELQLAETLPDKDIVLKGYQVWGEALLEKINGDFAFALYDKNRDEWLAARDPLGIKALYYVHTGKEYFFSDDIDELFRLSGIKKRPNIHAMRVLLQRGAINYGETMYEDIRRIPPGHYLKINGNDSIPVRYWHPENISIDYSISLKEAAEKFNTLFEKAIMERIGNDEETACELSGGLDSSSVVSLLKAKYPEKSIESYSMCFGDMQCDEYYYVKSIEEKYRFHTSKIDAHEIDYDQKYNFELNYNFSPHWPIMTTFTMYLPMLEKMHRDNKKVVITGQGGDHLLTGNCHTLRDLLRRYEFSKLLREIPYLPHSPVQLSAKCFMPFSLTQQQKYPIKKILRLLRSRETSGNQYIDDLFQLERFNPSAQKSDIGILISASESMLRDGNIFHAAEKYYGIEFRHPFYDKELIEFVLSLPPEYKYSQGWIKVLLRYAMKEILPEEIRSRGDKSEFSEVLTAQLEALDLKTLLKESQLVSLEIISRKKVDDLLYSFDHKESGNLLSLWTIVNLEYWYQYNFGWES